MAANTDIADLKFQINGVDFNLPAITKKCKFLISNTTTINRNDPAAKLNDSLDAEINDRFSADFLGHIATLQASAANPSTGWDLADDNGINNFLNVAPPSMPGSPTSVRRNLVVSIQVVLIDAAKAHNEANNTGVADADKDYGTNDVAIIQFPLYRSNPPGIAPIAFGGRRRTKAFKGKSSYRTRKHKKQVGTK
jgi:hypothetical protein